MDGLNYYVVVRAFNPDSGDCLLHFLHWDPRFDYRGSIFNVYLAPAGRYSEGILGNNTYSSDLISQAHVQGGVNSRRFTGYGGYPGHHMANSMPMAVNMAGMGAMVGMIPSLTSAPRVDPWSLPANDGSAHAMRGLKRPLVGAGSNALNSVAASAYPGAPVHHTVAGVTGSDANKVPRTSGLGIAHQNSTATASVPQSVPAPHATYVEAPRKPAETAKSGFVEEFETIDDAGIETPGTGATHKTSANKIEKNSTAEKVQSLIKGTNDEELELSEEDISAFNNSTNHRWMLFRPFGDHIASQFGNYYTVKELANLSVGGKNVLAFVECALTQFD
jgi:hypothetical protein